MKLTSKKQPIFFLLLIKMVYLIITRPKIFTMFVSSSCALKGSQRVLEYINEHQEKGSSTIIMIIFVSRLVLTTHILGTKGSEVDGKIMHTCSWKSC